MPARDLSQLLEAGQGAGLWLGAEALVARGQRVLFHRALGQAAERETPVWDMASLTKPVATASVLLSLGLPLEAPVSRWLPEYGQGDKARVTLRDLAAHTAGLAPEYRFIDHCRSPQEARAALLALPLQGAPGQGVSYSCLGYLLLGLALERAGGADLNILFHRHVAAPLGLDDSGFLPLEHGTDPARIMPAGKQGHSGGQPGIVHDSSAFAFGGIAGNAGLFGSARDLLRFARMLLSDAPPFPVQPMFAPQSPPGQPARSIGFEVNTRGDTPGDTHGNTPGSMSENAASCGPGFPAGAVGHTGFTGTSLWVDPPSGLIVILLSNRSAVSHRGNLADMAAFRRAFHRRAARLASPPPG